MENDCRIMFRQPPSVNPEIGPMFRLLVAICRAGPESGGLSDKRQELPSGRVIIQSATPVREAEWGSTGRREISPILVRCRGFEEWEADVAVEGDSQARKKWRTGVRH